jgi:hypothetical protein
MERIGLSPGAEIGGYTILAPLGSGGMGTVYRAVDGGGTAVALKLLHPHIGADPTSRERLRREVLALQRLRHPGVAAVLDAEADSTEAFLVTELVPGADLAEHVRQRGPLDATALHRLAAGLSDALAAVHAAGVVHRDLKPSNVLVTPDGPVLIDFGIAQSVDETRVTSTGFVVGTPGYLAPELVDGAEPTPATDWWGWAALLAFAATGRAPFGTRPLEAVLVRTRSGDADLAGLGPVTAGALWDALAADPADRAAPEEVVEALAEADRRGERYSAEAATVALALAAGGAGRMGTPAGGTVAFGGADATAVTSPPSVLPAGTAATVVLGAGAGAGAAASAGAAAGATAVIRPGDAGDGTAVLDVDGTQVIRPDHAAPVGWPPTTGTGGTGGTGGTESAESTAVLAPAQAPTRDGATRAFRPPSVAPGDPASGDWAEPGDHDLDPGGWLPDEDAAPPAPVDPPTRTVSLLAVVLLVVAGAALRPGWTLLLLLPGLLLARTVGSVADALFRRRERVGARSSDTLRAVATSPWHLLRALVTLLPSLLVAASVVVIVLGVGWWLVGSGALEAGPLRAADDAPTPQAASVLLAVAAAGGLAALAWGPLSRTTRTGARWLLAGVAPGRGGATVVVVLALAGVAVLAVLAATGTVVDWEPLPPPSLPAAPGS